ncbi:unnamed protein product [Trichogramma brassicae]|uniref:Uncharacterized protein n=1 Tax=Trichogramma brassicae TaxID=86971 RepID=A0A6H5IWY7_9HYME|nr:unnamed protein product [Trichogramma brassicae]
MPGGGTISEWCLRDLSAAGERPAGQADEGIEKIAEPCETRKQNAWSQGEFVTLELGGEAEESTQKKNRMRRGDKARVNESKSGEVVAPCERPRGDFSTPKPREDSLLDVTSKGRSRKTLRSVSTVENDRVSTLEERLSGEESSRGEKSHLKPGEDCTRGTIPRNTTRKDPTSGGVASATASSTVCRSQTQSLVSGEYNSDEEEIECLDSVYMATPETSMPDEQDGADSGPEEGVTVTTIADIHEPRESERRGPTRSIIYLDIAAMTRENRFFVDVRVGPFTYKALLDSGAQCCFSGPRMMRELAERIKPSMSLIGYANQQNTAVWWISASYATDRSRSWSNRHGMYGDSASRDGLGRGFRSTMESRYIHGPKSVAFRGRAMAQFRQIERGKVNAMRHCGRVCWYHSVWRRKGNYRE